MAGIPSIFRGSYTDPQLEKGLAMVLKSILGSYQNRVIVLCIGTDANIADSLGPLVGTMLVEAGASCRYTVPLTSRSTPAISRADWS